ncbi:WD repeat-containing protein 91, partial [Hondaea fermentalgiana]
VRRLRTMLENRQDPALAKGLAQENETAELDEASSIPKVESMEGNEANGAADVQHLTCVAESHHASRVNVCRFAPPMGASENRALVTASQDGTVRVWSWLGDPGSDLVQEQLIFCASEALSLDWHPERPELLAIGHANSTVRLWDVQARAQTSEFIVTGDPALPFVSDLRLSARRQVLATLCTGQSSAAVRRGSESGDRHAALFAPKAVAGVTGTAPLYTHKVTRRASVQLWSTTTSQLVASLPESERYWITSICFNHNGSLLVTGASDGKVRVFDVQKMTSIMEFEAAQCSVTKLVLTSDETAIVVIAADGGLSQWSLMAGTVVGVFILVVVVGHGINVQARPTALLRIDELYIVRFGLRLSV